MNLRKFTHLLAAAAVIAWAPALKAKIKIVATTPDLGAIAEAVTDGKASVTSLAKATEDPHFVDAKPSFMLQLSRADLLIEGGVDLESGWLAPLVQGSRNSRLLPGAKGLLAASRGIRLLEVPSVLDRSQGDIHAKGNPHYLMSPKNAEIAAANIAARLGEIDSGNAEAYRANAEKFIQQIEARIPVWKKKLAPFAGQRVVSYHNSWPYFSEAFGVKVDLYLEPKPGIPPTPAHLQSVIETMKREKIKAILAEPFVNKRTASKVAADTGAKVVDVSYFPGGMSGTDGDYIALMDKVVAGLAAALQP
jgi:zinc/manganese transport system substrate-binding protein